MANTEVIKRLLKRLLKFNCRNSTTQPTVNRKRFKWKSTTQTACWANLEWDEETAISEIMDYCSIKVGMTACARSFRYAKVSVACTHRQRVQTICSGQ